MTNNMMTPDEFREFYAQQASVYAASALEEGEVRPGEEYSVGLLRTALACLSQSGAHEFPPAEEIQNLTPINGPEVPFTYDNATDRSDFGATAFHYEEGNGTLTIFTFLPANEPHDIQVIRTAYRRALALAVVSSKIRESSYYKRNIIPLMEGGQLSERDVDTLRMLGRDYLHRAFDASESPRIAVVLLTDDQMEPKDFKSVQKLGAEIRKIFLSILSRFTLVPPALFDIRRLRREYAGEDTSAESNSVDFRDQNDTGNPLFGTEPIPCISSPDSMDSRTYVALMSGYALARIYEECGSALFQKNVRNFLGVRSKKVFGRVKSTLIDEPEKFLAYNNGLSATARKVIIEEGRIVAMEGLQIVNGAQTTGTVAHLRKAAAQAGKRADADESLRRALVLFKVTEVSDRRHGILVSKITMAANNQNTVPKGALDFTEKRWQFLPPFAMALNHVLSLRGGDTEQLKRENDARIKSGRVVERAEFAKWALVAAGCPWMAVDTGVENHYSTLWHHTFPETVSVGAQDEAQVPNGLASFVEEALLARMVSGRLNQDLIRYGVLIKSQKILMPYMVTLANLWSVSNSEWMSSMRRSLGGASSSVKMSPAPRVLVDLLEEVYLQMMEYQDKHIELYPTLTHLLRSPEGMGEFILEWTSQHGLPEMISKVVGTRKKQPKKAPEKARVTVDSPPQSIIKSIAAPNEDDKMWSEVEREPSATWDMIFAALSSKDRRDDMAVIEDVRTSSTDPSISQIRHMHRLLSQWRDHVYATSLIQNEVLS